jgi:hypothetical protein
MKSNELRIGNYVLYADESRTCILKVEVIHKNEIEILNNITPSTVKIKDIKGIPLTEDTILNCGFTKVGFFDNVYSLGYFRINLDKKTSEALLQYGDAPYYLNVEIKSVHELQNLYFALEKKELNITFEFQKCHLLNI